MTRKPRRKLMDARSRIVGSGMMRVDELLAHPLNFRIHPREQRRALEGSLRDLGWIDPLLVSSRTGRVLDGHLRADLAMEGGVAEVPVVWIDLEEEEEAEALVVLDPLAALALPDGGKLLEVLEEVRSAEDGVLALLASLRDDAARLAALEDGETREEEPPPGRRRKREAPGEEGGGERRGSGSGPAIRGDGTWFFASVGDAGTFGSTREEIAPWIVEGSRHEIAGEFFVAAVLAEARRRKDIAGKAGDPATE